MGSCPWGRLRRRRVLTYVERATTTRVAWLFVTDATPLTQIQRFSHPNDHSQQREQRRCSITDGRSYQQFNRAAADTANKIIKAKR